MEAVWIGGGVLLLIVVGLGVWAWMQKHPGEKTKLEERVDAAVKDAKNKIVEKVDLK